MGKQLVSARFPVAWGPLCASKTITLAPFSTGLATVTQAPQAVDLSYSPVHAEPNSQKSKSFLNRFDPAYDTGDVCTLNVRLAVSM